MVNPWVALALVMVLIIVWANIMVLLNARRAYHFAIRKSQLMFRRPPDGNEYRAVVIKAYRKLEANLSRYGIIRHDCETVRQYLARAADQLAIDKKALRDFLDTFEQARYSDHSCGEPERGRAINSLRAVQYSLERIVLTQEQLAVLVRLAETGGDAKEPGPKTLEGLGLRVVPPSVSGSVNIPDDHGGKLRDMVPPRDSRKEELLKQYGTPNVNAGDRLPKEEVDNLAGLVAGKFHAGFGTRLLELAGGPVKGLRVRVDPTLASYLLEFVARCEEAGRLRMKPGLDDSKVLLLASTVLAVAEGRDFLVPDDIKLALVSAGTLLYHTDTRDVVHILHGEIRQVPLPQGPAFLRPRPVLARGLAVPMD